MERAHACSIVEEVLILESPKFPTTLAVERSTQEDSEVVCIPKRSLMKGPLLLALVFTALQGIGVHAGGQGLFSEVTTLRDRTTHRASSADPTGGNDDNVQSFAPGETIVLLDTKGPGQINHLWVTVSPFRNHRNFMHDLAIRIFWENNEIPSVDVPLGAFFGQWHGLTYRVESLPIAVGFTDRAFNSFWPMPFHEHARIEIVNIGQRSFRRIYYQVDYELGEIPSDQGLFHAEFRRDPNLRTQPHEGNLTGEENYVLLETEGRGNYAGCFLFVDAEGKGWWGEGDEMTFIDGAETPTLFGTGAEDYFLNAWGYDQAFSYPFYGAPLIEKREDGSRSTVYRWHLTDPIRFSRNIRVTIEHTYDEAAVNDYASVAFWYQNPPRQAGRELPLGDGLAPRAHPDLAPPPQEGPEWEIDGTEFETALRSKGLQAFGKTSNHGMGYRFGGYLIIENAPKRVEVEIPVAQEGAYEVAFRPVAKTITAENPLKVSFGEGGAESKIEPVPDQKQVEPVALGTARSVGGSIRVILEGGRTLGIDAVTLKKVD